MNKNEFINKCVQSGYCSRKVAAMYAKNKDILKDDDFVEVFRIVERAKDIANLHDSKFRIVEGVRTTKRYNQSEMMGSDR